MQTITLHIVLALLGAVASIPSTAAEPDLARLPAHLADKVNAARQACAEIRGGEFALAWGAVTRTDLDGDRFPDWVLDESAFACSTAAALFCSTAGCASHFLVGDALASFQNQGWTLVTFGGDRVLLTRLHGTRCGGNAPTPCVAARVWDAQEKRWRGAEALGDQLTP